MPLGKGAQAVFLLVAAAALAQQQAPPEPPEEDETLIEKEYSFNPLQAEKEVKIGNYYFKKGNHRAAAARFLEALKWNAGYAEAWLRLGDARAKLKNADGAREAYRKYLEIEPQGKRAAEVKKKLAGKT